MNNIFIEAHLINVSINQPVTLMVLASTNLLYPIIFEFDLVHFLARIQVIASRTKDFKTTYFGIYSKPCFSGVFCFTNIMGDLFNKYTTVSTAST